MATERRAGRKYHLTRLDKHVQRAPIWPLFISPLHLGRKICPKTFRLAPKQGQQEQKHSSLAAHLQNRLCAACLARLFVNTMRLHESADQSGAANCRQRTSERKCKGIRASQFDTVRGGYFAPWSSPKQQPGAARRLFKQRRAGKRHEISTMKVTNWPRHHFGSNLGPKWGSVFAHKLGQCAWPVLGVLCVWPAGDAAKSGPT